MANKRTVTEEDILKAYDALGLEPDASLVKAEDSEVDNEEMDDADEDVQDDEDVSTEEDVDADEEDNDEDAEEDDADEEEEEGAKPTIKKGSIFDRFERIEKAIATSHLNNTTYVKALGVMVKACNQTLEKAKSTIELSNAKIDELTEINKAQADTINSLQESLESFGAYTPAPKSMRAVAKPVERNFSKGFDDELNKGGHDNDNEVNILNKSAVAEILDQATFAKGYDDEFSKACMDYEASGNVSDSVIARIKKEFGITIVK